MQNCSVKVVRMKILLFVDQLYLGGAGRVASILVSALEKRGYQITVVYDKSFGLTYPLPQSVKTIQSYKAENKNIVDKICNTIKRWLFIRKQIKTVKPDLIIAFLPPIFVDVKIASLFLNIPIIASDHTSMLRDLGVWVNFVRHRGYALADAVTILTYKDKNYLGSRLANKHVVYNPLTFEPITSTLSREKIVLCAGRVSQWSVKGFDRMVEVWSRLSRKYPEWRLFIAGPNDPASVAHLRSLVQDEKVVQNIEFLGQVDDIQSLYRRAAIFALPSRVEGFPMVLIEAMSQGCACLSFQMQGAVNEIMTDGKDGLIVDDGNIERFTQRLDSLMEDEQYRTTLATQAIESVARFSEDCFAQRWVDIIKHVTRS